MIIHTFESAPFRCDINFYRTLNYVIRMNNIVDRGGRNRTITSSEIGIRVSFRNVSFCGTGWFSIDVIIRRGILLDVSPRKDTYSRSKCKFVQVGNRIPRTRSPVVAPDATGEIIIRPMCNSRTYHVGPTLFRVYITCPIYNFVSRNRRNMARGDARFKNDGLRNKWTDENIVVAL